MRGDGGRNGDRALVTVLPWPVWWLLVECELRSECRVYCIICVNCKYLYIMTCLRAAYCVLRAGFSVHSDVYRQRRAAWRSGAVSCTYRHLDTVTTDYCTVYLLLRYIIVY